MYGLPEPLYFSETYYIGSDTNEGDKKEQDWTFQLDDNMKASKTFIDPNNIRGFPVDNGRSNQVDLGCFGVKGGGCKGYLGAGNMGSLAHDMCVNHYSYWMNKISPDGYGIRGQGKDLICGAAYNVAAGAARPTQPKWQDKESCSGANSYSHCSDCLPSDCSDCGANWNYDHNTPQTPCSGKPQHRHAPHSHHRHAPHRHDPFPHKYYHLGPFRDTRDRAMRHYAGNGHNVDSCAHACGAYTYFGLQYFGYCFCDNDFYHVRKYGPSSCGYTGGAWCNYVYQDYRRG